MKKIILSIGLLFVAATVFATTQTKTTQDKPARVFMFCDIQQLDSSTNHNETVYENADGDFIPDDDDSSWNNKAWINYNHVWVDAIGGAGSEFNNWQNDNWDWQNNHTSTTGGRNGNMEWDWTGWGAEVGTSNDGTTTTGFTNILWIWDSIGNEHCNMNDPINTNWDNANLDWDDDGDRGSDIETYTRTADTIWHVQTGGKAIPGRRNLWQFSGSAWKITDKRAVPPFSDSVIQEITDKTQIVLKDFGALKSDGNLWLTLPDDIEKNITPTVPGNDFYTFTVQGLPVDITIKKQGDAAPPTDGVVVKNGDTLTISLIGSSQTPITSSSGQPVWKYRQLKSDGTYTDWQPFGTSGTGVQFDYTTTTSGIFQAEAVFYGNNANAAKYLRKIDELKTSNGFMGPGRKGDPDSFGVCDTQMQIDIRNEAKSYLGSTAYDSHVIVPAEYGFSAFGTNGNQVMRCNIFVAHRCCAVGATVPAINGWLHHYPPLANQWAGVMSTSRISFSTAISGWPLLSNIAFPQPGFIIAHPDASDSGHCAIIDYDGGGIGAGMSGTVNKNYDEFYDGTSHYRQYQP